MGRLKSYRVQDERGVGFVVFEREHTEESAPGGLQRKVFTFELETGEPGRFVDPDTFVLSHTGETFSIVRRINRRRIGVAPGER